MMPLGRMKSTTMNNKKEKITEEVDITNCAVTDSTTPRISPPMRAPGTLPNPPRTTTMNDLIPSYSPMDGFT